MQRWMKFSFPLVTSLFGAKVGHATPDVGSPAPAVALKTHDGTDFTLESRRGKGWTVLYFYPKADTPGCTKQACTFRDGLKNLQAMGVEVYGISSDGVESLKKFHEKYHLNFTLLADPQAKVIEAYGAKTSFLNFAKRWTFLVDPDLVVRHVEKNVDPVKDAPQMTALVKKLSAESKH